MFATSLYHSCSNLQEPLIGFVCAASKPEKFFAAYGRRRACYFHYLLFRPKNGIYKLYV